MINHNLTTSRTYTHLYDIANSLKIIDTHEHLEAHENFIGEKPDFLCDYFSHYITADLMAAGMPEVILEKIRDYKIELIERWDMLEPYLDCVRNTSYFKSIEIAANAIHNIDEISRETIAQLNESFIRKVSDENYKRYIMKDLCNIEISLNDRWSYDVKAETTELFACVCHPEAYVMPHGSYHHETLSDYCEEYKQRYHKLKTDGMKSLKLAIAYERSLYFEDVGFEEAEELFTKYNKEGNEGYYPKKLQDYIMHYVLQLANDDGFVIQIHTGLQEGMRNDLENSNPMLLKNLFARYPNLAFDLFHIGYPYDREIITLAKYHPNVYIDMCWANIISPYAAREFFKEALDVLPYNKIFAFGGDYLFYDGVVGHVTLAKRNICEVLTEKVDRGEYKLALAEKILKAVLYSNAKRVFKL